jgi:iron complex outermembrane receptor protein
MPALVRPSRYALASAILLVHLAADARASAAALDEVVVMAQRQAYRGDVPLAEIPQSITVLDAELLREAGVTRLAEALDLSASVSRQNDFGGLWEAFAVRGFAGDENLPSGYLVNGFNAGRGFGGPRDASGIERVEVLKGPNAALFGRGEPGGTVNLVTKRPTFAAGGYVGASAGRFDRYRGEVDSNQPFGDTLAVRVTGFYEDAGSFRDTIESERYGANPAVLVRLGERTSLGYELEYSRQEIPFDRGVVAIDGRLGAVPSSRFVGEPGDGPLEAKATGHQLQLQHDFDADWSLLLGAGYRDTSLDGFSSEAELATNRQRLFVDGRTLSRQRRFRDYDAEHTVLRGEIAGRFETGAIEHRVLVGADHDAFDNDQVFLRFRPPTLASNPSPQAGYAIDVFAPVYGRFPPPTPGPQTDRLDEQRAWGVYVQDQVRLTERLQARVGLRYDDYSLEGLNRASGARVRAADSKLSPQAGVVFDATDTVALYVAYGEGFRPNSGVSAAGQPFDPEESQSFEVGARWAAADGRLSATLAAFSLDKSNILTADPQNPGFSLAIGEAESRGIELDVTGRLPADLQLWFSYAYVDAEAAQDALDPNFGLAIRAGDRLINVPEHSLSAQLSRRFAVGTGSITAGAGVQYVGARLGETATTFELPAYTLARLFATWAPTERLELEARLDNAFDETWYPNSFSRVWVAAGAPRRGTVTVRWRW